MDMTPIEQSIRLAAIKLISRTGYELMSIRQLAAEADINLSTLYAYYNGKQELLLTLVLDYLEKLSDAWDLCCPRKSTAAEMLRVFVQFHVRYHLLHKEQAVLGNMELWSLEDSDRELVKQARQGYLAKLQSILEQGVVEGSLRCDEPKLLARIIFNMLTHASAWYRDDGRLEVDEIVVQYTELVLCMLDNERNRPARLAYAYEKAS